MNGNVTPYTQQPVPQISSTTWETASLSDLWEQMSVLNARYIAVAQMGKQEYMEPLKRAMAELQAIIQHRSTGADNTIT